MEQPSANDKTKENKTMTDTDDKRRAFAWGFDPPKDKDYSALTIMEGNKIKLILYGAEAVIVHRALEQAALQQSQGADELLDKGYELSTWAACIDWRGGRNQKEWLDDLRTLIEDYQAMLKALRTRPAAKEEENDR